MPEEALQPGPASRPRSPRLYPVSRAAGRPESPGATSIASPDLQAIVSVMEALHRDQRDLAEAQFRQQAEAVDAFRHEMLLEMRELKKQMVRLR